MLTLGRCRLVVKYGTAPSSRWCHDVPVASSALVLLYPGAISFEIMLAIELLGQVDVVSSNDCDHRDTSGLTIKPTVGIDAALKTPYETVVVPGGNPDSIAGEKRTASLLHGAVDRRATIAGICAGVVVLADAGVLTTRRVTHNYGPDSAPEEVVAATAHLWRDVEVVDRPCVVDKQPGKPTVVTALPWAYIDFAVTIARLAGRFDDTEAKRRAAYYRGSR